MPIRRVTILSLLTGLAMACTPEDDERCGDGFEWDGNSCVEIGDSEDGNGEEETGGDEETDSDSGEEGESDQEGELPEGMGTTCTDGGGECDGLEASYCTANPMNPDGYCTVTECTTGSCPDTYVCCDMTVGDPLIDVCITPEDFETMSGIGLCAS